MSNDSISPSGAPKGDRNFLVRFWDWFMARSRYGWGLIATTFFVVGVAFWGAFNWGLEATNTEQFCISCHEMKTNVYTEYRNTVHYSNKTGVRATCPDCHVPKEWGHKMVRKVQASYEVWHKILGTIDTPEKFAAYRPEMSASVWRAMKTTDSRECRNCHDFKSMEFSAQEPRAGRLHQTALNQGKTCIDCHQGIAHKLPPKAAETYQAMLDNIDNVSLVQKVVDFLQGADVAKAKVAPR